MGGKTRFVKRIIDNTAKLRGELDWVEPFAGGFNVTSAAVGVRWGNDVCKYATSVFQALQMGWSPYDVNVTEEFYNTVKANPEKYDDHIVGFLGYSCSFGGKFFGGYTRPTSTRNYVDEQCRALTKQAKTMKDVRITNMNYCDMDIDNSFVYCDPPYANTESYSNPFNSETFYDWVRTTISRNNIIVVSEYDMPDDFVSIYNFETKTTLARQSGETNKRIEHLFIHQSQAILLQA